MTVVLPFVPVMPTIVRSRVGSPWNRAATRARIRNDNLVATTAPKRSTASMTKTLLENSSKSFL